MIDVAAFNALSQQTEQDDLLIGPAVLKAGSSLVGALQDQTDANTIINRRNQEVQALHDAVVEAFPAVNPLSAIVPPPAGG